jgi:hypothetical protein
MPEGVEDLTRFTLIILAIIELREVEPRIRRGIMIPPRTF